LSLVIGLYSRLKSGGNKMEHNMYTVTELFGPCAQGEGRYVGAPSIFLRLFGCNLQCQGFGMPKGELSHERDLVANNGLTYDTVDSLPLVRTGCDSYAAWDTRFKYLSKQYTIQELVDKIKSMLPNGSFQQTTNNNIHLVITGGESLLPHWQKNHCEFIHELRRQLNLKYLTFETNGTQVLSEELTDVLNLVSDVTFSVSPKLSASGEPRNKTIKKEAINSYFKCIGTTYLKFVVGDESNFDEVEDVLNELEYLGDVFIMPVGGCYDEYKKIAPIICDLCMKKGYRYTPRLHIDLFGNCWGK